MEQAFTDIYRHRNWGEGSGPGSTGQSNLVYKGVLQSVLRSIRPCRVLDLGCGYHDPYAGMDWSGVRYFGVDVVADVIKHNDKVHGSPGKVFVQCDVEAAAPRMFSPTAFDLVVMKDVLQHWATAKVLPFLRYLSRFPRVLLTNSTNGTLANGDCPDGGYRALDLRLPPFSLPALELASYEVWENPEFDRKTVLLWMPSVFPWKAPPVSLPVVQPGGPRAGQLRLSPRT